MCGNTAFATVGVWVAGRTEDAKGSRLGVNLLQAVPDNSSTAKWPMQNTAAASPTAGRLLTMALDYASRHSSSVADDCQLRSFVEFLEGRLRLIGGVALEAQSHPMLSTHTLPNPTPIGRSVGRPAGIILFIDG